MIKLMDPSEEIQFLVSEGDRKYTVEEGTVLLILEEWRVNSKFQQATKSNDQLTKYFDREFILSREIMTITVNEK